jgi:hypothetical protein
MRLECQALLVLAALGSLSAQQLNFARQDLNTGASPVAMAVADFNQDGKADLAICCPSHR